MKNQLTALAALTLGASITLGVSASADACTRLFYEHVSRLYGQRT